MTRCGSWPRSDGNMVPLAAHVSDSNGRRVNRLPGTTWFFALMTVCLFCGCASLPSSVKAVRDLEYARVDGQSLKLDLYLPRKPNGKLPVVVWIHGGSWNSGSKDFCPIAFMATRNAAIVSLNYRLT